MTPVLVIVLTAAAIATIIILVSMSARRYRRRFKTLMRRLHATQNGWSAGGTLEGFEYTITFNPRDPNLSMEMRHPFGHSVDIVQENMLHRLGKRSGLVDEVQSGDEAFDRRFFLDGDNSEFVASFVGNELRRRHIKGIFDTHPGIAELQVRPEYLHITLFPCSLNRTELGHDVALALLTRLAAICEAEQRSISIPSTVYVPRTIEANRFTKAIIGASGGSLVLGVALLLYGISAYRPLDTLIFTHGFYGGLPLGLGAAAGIVLAFRGRPYALRSIGITSLLAIAGSILLVMGIMLIYNGGADAGSVREHIVTVQDKITTRGKSPGFKLVVSSWRPHHETETITVTQNVFAAVHADSRMWVRAARGKLGYAWLHSYGVLGRSP